ncbi:hypothetical protein K435DRAFT_782436 [Dendrothele bispora CBS 962.96]|uniref:Uncharacterized protein n=1 Tax=Dendrothele bispora (strain CBS 962.96) TaxID=1314807 RepID=A0A4S8LF00_DENBC|nr:hypothetical protein K435DRAFT_782436 [Dendrothele bispora CBS 962.96]
MSQLDPNNMGTGRLNASTIGRGIIAPYPLHHPSSASPTSPTFLVPSHHTGSSGEEVTGPNNVNSYGPQGQGR